ncbi:MAG: acyltransferase domain-containing protein [Anaerolineales bacterium]
MKLNGQTTAFLFPGQGSQSVGMGKDLAAQYPAAKQLFDEADALFGRAFSQLMWDGPDTELNETINTQPALFIHSIAAWRTFTRFPLFRTFSLSQWRAFSRRTIGSRGFGCGGFCRRTQTRPHARRIDETRGNESRRHGGDPRRGYSHAGKSARRRARVMKLKKWQTIIVPGQVVISVTSPRLNARWRERKLPRETRGRWR